MTAQVDTSKVTDHRKLHFNTIDAILTEAERIVASERAGKLRRSGNWTAGQTFGHLATWINFAYEGTPLKPPWFIKLMFKIMVGKKKFLNGPMRLGVRIPKVAGGTLGTEVLPLEEGYARLKKALERLRTSAPTQPNALFGPMTHEEWIKINLRHAEMHMGFMHP